MPGQTLGQSGQVQPATWISFLHCAAVMTEPTHGGPQCLWGLWKATGSYERLLCPSFPECQSLIQKKRKLQLSYLAVLKFMGQGGFQASAPAGHCSDDV